MSLGSSPRLRGTSTSLGHGGHACGIIPALAGNIRFGSVLMRLAWDHPRACGEHATVGGLDVSRTGSSPRLRGTSHSGSVNTDRIGIIPALAGNIVPDSFRRIIEWDHPRACGEHGLCTRQARH